MPFDFDWTETATTAPSGARRFVRDTMAGWAADGAERAADVASELARISMTQSGATAVRVNVERRSDAVRVEVSGNRRRTAHGPDTAELLDELLPDLGATGWGVDERADGPVVWFELSLRTPQPARGTVR